MVVGREVGSVIFLANEDIGVKVSLTDPEVIFYVEVRDNQAYIFQDYIRCHAGLPVGSQGKVVAHVEDDRGLVSAWLMMKRGCRVLLRGEDYLPLLRQYDPIMKAVDRDVGRNIFGYVLGTRLEDVGKVDVSSYDLPVYFPTMGMTDEEVEILAETIRNGL